VIAADTLRLPGPLDPARGAYKDWFHLNVFDHDAVGLVNVALQGPPADAAAHVVTTALIDMPGAGWSGNVSASSWSDASITLSGVATPAGALTLVDDQVLAVASVEGLRVDVRARPVTSAFSVELPQPFGSGWIAWRVVPRLVADGTVAPDGATPRPTPRAYHDHSWGRWHWGDDIGWEWGSFMASDHTSVVIARTTDRRHLRSGPWTVIVDHAGTRRTFSGRRVEASWSDVAPAPSRRLPGALAALHADRRRPRLPGTLRVVARSGRESLELEFTCRAVAQLILADPIVPGTSFLHEMSGRFRATGVVAGRTVDVDGLGMVERLE
jgi:hypothetical protein